MRHLFATGNWDCHINTSNHKAKKNARENNKRHVLKGKATHQKIYRQMPMLSFMSKVKKNSITEPDNIEKSKAGAGTVETKNIEKSQTEHKLLEVKKANSSCAGIIHNIKVHKTITSQVHLYCKYSSSKSSSLFLRGEIGETPQLFSKKCNGNGFFRSDKRHKGYRCNECQTFLLSRGGRLVKATVINRAKNFKRVEKCLMKISIDEDDAEFMVNFTRQQMLHLSEIGITLMEEIRTRLDFYRECQKSVPQLTTKKVKDGLDYVEKTVQAPNDLISTFTDIYNKNKEMQNSLLVCLLKAFTAKMTGERNPKYADKALNFFTALHTTSKKSFDFVSANFLGLSLRHMMRINAADRQPSFLILEKQVIFERLHKHLKLLRCHSPHIVYSLSFDGTKVPKILQMSARHNAIFGACYPDHIIDVKNKEQNEILNILKDKNIPRAEELKVAVITFQRVPSGVCPFYVLGARCQSVNESNNFNESMVEICEQYQQEKNQGELISCAADGVSVDGEFLRKTLFNFLDGKTNISGVVDSNHNTKSFRYQLIGGSCVMIMGNHIIDPELLRLSGVSKELWRISDFASDLLPLKLASKDTVLKLCSLQNESEESISVLCITLYLARLKLFAVNTSNLEYQRRIALLWASMIWMTSFTHQGTSITKKRNIVTETIGLIFLFARKDVMFPRYCTEEPCEHVFGGWRQEKREATIIELVQIEEKRRRKLEAIYKGDLKINRSRKKGYQATFEDFVTFNKTEKDSVHKNKGFQGSSHTIVDLLWSDVSKIINSCSNHMKKFLDMFGVDEVSLSPFCKEFKSREELLKEYIEYCPKTFSYEIQGSNNDTGENSNDGIMMEDRNIEEYINSSLRELVDTVSISNHNVQVLEEDVIEDSDENTSLFLANHLDNIMRKFQDLLFLDNVKKGTNVALNAIDTICCIKGRESGSIKLDQKFKSLQQRWFTKSAVGNNGDENLTSKEENLTSKETFIERNILLKFKVEQGSGTHKRVEDQVFRVLCLFDKYYNTWFLSETPRKKWSHNRSGDSYRVIGRMVQYDFAFRVYEDVNPSESMWNTTSIFVLRDQKDIIDVIGYAYEATN